MSTETNTPPPMPGTPKPTEAPPLVAPMTMLATIDMLLKKPFELLVVLASSSSLSLARRLTLVGVLGLLIFGFVVGTFSGGMQLWAAPTKIVLGLAVSGLMCLPSLYIFSCLAGLRANFTTLIGLQAAMLGLTALLLAGFTPVIWVFGQSTESVGFMGALTLLIWGVSGAFGLGILQKAKTSYGTSGGAHLTVWLVVFTLVTLQMSTALRPIIGPGEKEPFLPATKMFFLEHWGNALTGETRIEKPSTR